MIIIDISGAHAAIRAQQTLTCGMTGQPVLFRLDETWADLTKTAVFRAGDITRDVAGIADVAVIPHEVLTVPGVPLQIGLYGTDPEGGRVLPTVWVSTDPICPGADPSGDPGLAPTSPAWQEALTRVTAMETQLGDVEMALDAILDMQASLMGGESQ